MRRKCEVIAVLFAVMLTAGCGDWGRPYVASNVTVDKPVVGRPTFGMPIIVPESEWILVPFTFERPQRWFEADAAYGASVSYTGTRYGSLLYWSPNRVEWHNLVFHNPESGESRALLNHRAVISRFNIPQEKKGVDEATRPPFLLYGITDRDTDGDGVLGVGDAVVGYMSDLDGRNLRQITPADTLLKGIAYDWSSRTFYLVVVWDSDGDDKFTSEDEAQLLAYSLKDGKLGQRLLSAEVREDVEQIMRQ